MFEMSSEFSSICSSCCYYGCRRRQDTSNSNFLKVHVRAYLHAKMFTVVGVVFLAVVQREPTAD